MNEDNQNTGTQGQDQGNKPQNNVLSETIKEHEGADIRPDTQEMLNKPLAGTMEEEDRKFLEDVVAKTNSKEINLYEAKSLLNTDIYESLTPEQEAKVDLILQALLFTLRQITGWHQAGEKENIQMANMIHDARVKKENLEKEVGDVLKI